MVFLADSNLFYIIVTRKKGFGFGTFGLGQNNQGRTVYGKKINWFFFDEVVVAPATEEGASWTVIQDQEHGAADVV